MYCLNKKSLRESLNRVNVFTISVSVIISFIVYSLFFINFKIKREEKLLKQQITYLAKTYNKLDINKRYKDFAIQIYQLPNIKKVSLYGANCRELYSIPNNHGLYCNSNKHVNFKDTPLNIRSISFDYDLNLNNIYLEILSVTGTLLLVLIAINLLINSVSTRKIILKLQRNILKVLANDIDEDIFDEIQPMKKKLAELNKKLQDEHKKNIELELASQKLKLKKQLAHDIRSPLASLKSIICEDLNDQENQDILNSSVERIEQLANALLKETQDQKSLVNKDLNEMIYKIALEKKHLINQKKIALSIIDNKVLLYSKLVPNQFLRVLSNLIDNSVEAIESKGRIEISYRRELETNLIKISDNGKGIPNDILLKLQQKGFSFGKANGNGLGLEYSRTKVREFGGDLSIESIEGEGTTVTLTLPTCAPPRWLANELSVKENATIAIYDDVISIHQLWNQKIASDLSNTKTFNLYNLNRPIEADLYLVDYEFDGTNENGLDFIVKNNLKNAYLCTSHYEDKQIQKRCEESNIKMIPKDSISNIKFKITKAKSVIHIDDDFLIRKIWKKEAKKQNIGITSFSSASEVRSVLQDIQKDAIFYIDENLGEEKGSDLAKELFESGYENLYLSSGYEDTEFSGLPFIKGNIGKEPPPALNSPA